MMLRLLMILIVNITEYDWRNAYIIREQEFLLRSGWSSAVRDCSKVQDRIILF